MAGPRPDQPYNPTPTVEPNTGMPADFLQAQANPSETGGLVAAAQQKAGQTLEGIGNEASAIAIERQGQINETLFTNADSDYANKAGSIYGQYKALKGLDAVAAQQKAVSDLQSLRNQIRSSLPNDAARRGFDQLSLRRESYMITDVDGYAAAQIKEANTSSATAAINLASDESGLPSIANNDYQFGQRLGTIKHYANIVVDNQGYGSFMHVDGKTGAVSFDSGPQGDQAKVIYTEYLNKAQGEAWTNRIKTLAYDAQGGNVSRAMAVLQENKNNMPASVFADLSKQLSTQYRLAQSKTTADNIFGSAYGGYLQTVDGEVKGKYNPQQLLPLFTQQETGGGKTDPNNINQLQLPTWNQYAKPGEVITNAKDNNAVATRFLTDLYNNPKIGGDPERVAVAYFSGATNVRPIGEEGPAWLEDKIDSNGKHVSSYVQDMVGRMQGAGGTHFTSFTDYLRTNEDTIVQNAFDQKFQETGDVQIADQTRQLVATRIKQEIGRQEDAVRADRDTTMNWVVSNNIVDPSQIASAPKNIQDAFHNGQANDFFGMQGILRVMETQAVGNRLGYGTNIYNLAQDVLSGKIKDSLGLTTSLASTADAPLTINGFKALKGLITEVQDPKNAGFTAQVKNLFEQYHKEATGEDIYPGIQNPAGEARFEKWMQEAVPKLHPGADFDSKSKDYVGNSYVQLNPGLNKMMNEIMAARTVQVEQNPSLNPTPAATKTWGQRFGVDAASQEHAAFEANRERVRAKTGVWPSDFDPASLQSVDDLLKAAADPKNGITEDEFKKLVVQRGWARSTQ